VENLKRLFDNNRKVVEEVTASDPEYFTNRAGKQEPYYLFIGCADSRVPLESLTGSAPGEMFVHRNIANQALNADLNVLSVLQYAIEVLDVKHVIVCGHYQCGGVKAAMGDQSFGLVDYWLAGVRDTVRRHDVELRAIASPQERFKRVVELNVLRQVYNLSRTPVVQNAWKRGRRPLLHGVVYDLQDGLLRPLALEVDGPDKAQAIFEGRRESIGD
jgi:carbonic anhydrase